MPLAIETIEEQAQQLGFPHVFYPAFSEEDAIKQIGQMRGLAKARIITVSQADWNRILFGKFDGFVRQKTFRQETHTGPGSSHHDNLIKSVIDRHRSRKR